MQYSVDDVMKKIKDLRLNIPADTMVYYGICRVCSINGIFYRYSFQIPLKQCTVAGTLSPRDFDVFRLHKRNPMDDETNPVFESAPFSDTGMMANYIAKAADHDGKYIACPKRLEPEF